LLLIQVTGDSSVDAADAGELLNFNYNCETLNTDNFAELLFSFKASR
jgi:hypothetical protein